MSAITTTLLVVHSLIVLALIGIVLIQRSEGGALGIGGGGGGFMSGRGAANVLTRTTSVLAALFFATSISLAVLAPRGESEADLIRDLTGEELPSADGETSIDDLTRTLGRDDPQPAQTRPTSPAASDPAAEPQSPAAETAQPTAPATVEGTTPDTPAAPASGETPSAETPAADAQAPEEAPLEPDNESR